MYWYFYWQWVVWSVFVLSVKLLIRKPKHLAPESDPGVRFALQDDSSDEGLVVAHVDAGQVASLMLAGRLSRVPGRRLLHQLVAVQVPGDVASRAGARGRGWRVDAACWCGSKWRKVSLMSDLAAQCCLSGKNNNWECLLTFLHVADEAVFLMTGVIVPLAAHQVVVSHRHTVFLLRTTRRLQAF